MLRELTVCNTHAVHVVLVVYILFTHKISRGNKVPIRKSGINKKHNPQPESHTDRHANRKCRPHVLPDCVSGRVGYKLASTHDDADAVKDTNADAQRNPLNHSNRIPGCDWHRNHVCDSHTHADAIV